MGTRSTRRSRSYRSVGKCVGTGNAGTGVGCGTGGVKDDAGKNQLELLPWRAVEAVGRVLTYGARKYAPEGWRSVPEASRRYTGALLRHIAARELGEVIDPESKLLHLAHVACNALFLLELEIEKRGER